MQRSSMRRRVVIVALLLSVAAWLWTAWWLLEHKATARRAVMLTFGMSTLDGVAQFGPELAPPTFLGPDASRSRVPITLVKVAEGFQLPTDIVFLPGERGLMLVAQKTGRCDWVDVQRQTRGKLFEVEVTDEGEMGLLGLAAHPRFVDNHKLYVHYNVPHGDTWRSRITEWSVRFDADGSPESATQARVLLEIDQPYSNHKGGQLAFGPDGFLYIGMGDGGDGGDPHGNGQNLGTLLGKMLRIDVDHRSGSLAYAIPRDNPFVGRDRVRPEVWALGLRNPWRFSFDTRGRLIAADVGQERWEELTFVERGHNLGWNVLEGRECYVLRVPGTPNANEVSPDSACDRSDITEPFYVYGRDDGSVIIGGYEALSDETPALKGKYVFADCVRGKLWALDLPSDTAARVVSSDVLSLGSFGVVISALGRDAGGRLYVADLGAELNSGTIYRIAAP